MNVVPWGISRSTGRADEVSSDFADRLTPHIPMLFRLAREVLRSEQAAADAVQDTLEAAWRKRGSLRDERALSAWLTQICLRRCLTARTRSKTTRVVEIPSGMADTRSDRGSDLDLHRALGHLSRQQRAVLVLHYRDGYTLDECSVFLKCRPGTVRQHLHRGLAKLRRGLANAEQ